MHPASPSGCFLVEILEHPWAEEDEKKPKTCFLVLTFSGEQV